ncbi:hypothetical protein GCM10010211_20640 [Streptomyces albospinus]|uniref:Uncharacterized protein n=2 Tax=Streptomyces albospinus TaxID=285515 RepID=A0ABQ2UWQ1_9ACTN|nr:hypothetical protein GCM10010211_20640 [Streptomyces albospinus]
MVRLTDKGLRLRAELAERYLKPREFLRVADLEVRPQARSGRVHSIERKQ